MVVVLVVRATVVVGLWVGDVACSYVLLYVVFVNVHVNVHKYFFFFFLISK
jgi:hypothetical protein